MAAVMFQVIIALTLASAVQCKSCCAPKQWEGMQTLATGYSKGTKQGQYAQTYIISYDAIGQKIAKAGKMKTPEHEVIDYKIILDYGAKKGYQIHTKTAKCKVYDLPATFREMCSPASAQLIDTSYFGIGENRLDSACYQFPSTDGVADLMTLSCVSSDECVPISEDITGTFKGSGVFVNVNTYGLTPGIRDPSVFNPPANCVTDPFDILGDDFYERYSMTHRGSVPKVMNLKKLFV